MINQIILKIGCVIVAGVLVAMLVHKRNEESSGELGTSGERRAELTPLPLGGMEGESQTDGSELASQDRLASAAVDRQGGVSLRVGKIAATPGRDEIVYIPTLPILESEVRRLYALAKAASCRIVTPGAAVLPTVTSPLPGEASTIGRVPSVTVGLEMASEGRSKLPAVTRGQVDSYFAKHRLSIQPVVYCDPAGHYYFGTDCQAAFFELERPGIAIQPEPMIESAVARFRSLGVLASPEDESALPTQKVLSDRSATPSGAGRSLVMAFTFEKGEQLASGVAASDHQATELLLFHLPEQALPRNGQAAQASGAADIEMQVFVTSDGRRILNRLDLPATDIHSSLPTISAEIRFDKMILMGLYPAEPVVTQIHYQSAGVLSMELVEKLMKGSSERSGLSLSEILDQFALLSQSLSRPAVRDEQSASTVPGQVEASDDSWYQEMSRRKYESLNKSLQPIEKKDAPF